MSNALNKKWAYVEASVWEKQKHWRCSCVKELKASKETPTSLGEKLSVDVFKGVFIDDSAGTFLEEQRKTFDNTEKKSRCHVTFSLLVPSSGETRDLK